MTAARVSRRARRNVITDARQPSSADLGSRQLRYTVTMAFRVACFIAMIWVPGPFRWVLLAAAVVLPYVAVLFANQADQRGSREHPETAEAERDQLADPYRRQLSATPGAEQQPGRYRRRADDIDGETEPTSDRQPNSEESR